MAARRTRGVQLTREERLEVRRLIENGSSFEQAAVAARCSTKTVQRVPEAAPVPPHHGLGLDDDKTGLPPWPDPG